MMDTTGMRETAETRARVNRGIWFAALLCGLIGDGRAQGWNTSSGIVWTDAKVGIGYNPPGDKLNIQGTLGITGGSSNNHTAIWLRAGSTGGDKVRIAFRGDNQGEYAQIVGAVTTPASGAGSAKAGRLVLRTALDSVLKDRLTITETGSVIINQATQTNAMLHVEADGRSDSAGSFPGRGIVSFTSWAGSGPSTDNDMALFRFQAARISTTSPNAGNATLFEVCNDDRRLLNIRGDGRMGIGTKQPEGMLHLEMDGTIQSPGSFPANGGVKFASWANNGPATDAGKALFFFEAGRLSATDSYAANARIFEVANDDGRIITVRGNGLVGIGKENPQAKLHVGGDLKIDGAIKVASWTVAPDYVFEKDYKMASLQEVESFVQKNKHLPEVPSAKTIKEKGLDLAEMNLLLLKKVEELTLHAIRQEKRMKRQEIEMKSQREEIRKLKGKGNAP